MKEGRELNLNELDMINGGFIKYASNGTVANLFNDNTGELVASYSLKTVKDQQDAVTNIQKYVKNHPGISTTIRLDGTAGEGSMNE